jgi:hypothetical protein
VGAAAGYAWNGSVVVRALQAKTTALSIRPAVRGTVGTGLQLRPGFEALTEQLSEGRDIDLTEASRYMISRSWSVGGDLSLALAHAFGRTFGMQLALGGGVERAGGSYYEDGAEQTFSGTLGILNGGVALSFDANPIPLAIMLEYDVDVALAAGGLGIDHKAGLGVYLNGMTNTVGLELAGITGASGTQLQAGLGFRSYF